MSKTLSSNFALAFAATFPQIGEVIRTGKRGRPAKRDIARIANNANATLSDGSRAVAERAPWDALRILATHFLPLTDSEKAEILEEAEAKFQRIDPASGHVIQDESRAGFEFSTLADGEELVETVIIPTALAMAKRTGTVHFIRLQRWAASRSFRVGNGETLAGRTAPFQHKVYVSDRPQKQGFLLLGIAHPNGSFERLAVPQEAPVEAPAEAQEAPQVVEAPVTLAVVETPVTVTETQSEKDARRKREKRAKAKAEKESQAFALA